MFRYRARFSYNYYQFVHFHSEKIFVADNLEQAQQQANEYLEQHKNDTDKPFLREIKEL